QIADRQAHAGEETAGEPTAGRIVTREEQEHRVDDQRIEEQPGYDLEDDGTLAGRQRPRAGEPTPPPRRALSADPWRGTPPYRGTRSRADEDEARDAGRRHHEH